MWSVVNFAPRFLIPIIAVLSIIAVYIFTTLGLSDRIFPLKSMESPQTNMGENLDFGEAEKEPHTLSIEALRKGNYPGSDIVVEQTLDPGSNYQRQIVSYKSEGLKIYALLTVPNGNPPESGWPVIIFNHGYIPPAEYRTTERYIAYTDGFSRNEYVLLRPDYRGQIGRASCRERV